jgi:Asp-tRNA(Asn)/Glu-tRNA(Gln) amidotransferase A subunit family amidase
MGLQLVARPGQDAFLLRVAAIFEKMRPWAHRRPNLPELAA